MKVGTNRNARSWTRKACCGAVQTWVRKCNETGRGCQYSAPDFKPRPICVFHHPDHVKFLRPHRRAISSFTIFCLPDVPYTFSQRVCLIYQKCRQRHRLTFPQPFFRRSAVDLTLPTMAPNADVQVPGTGMGMYRLLP